MSDIEQGSGGGRQLERRILVELDDIEKRIESLRAEKAALQRLLVEVRRKTTGLPDVTRKNSINRILIEEKILSVLKKSERALSTKALLREVLAFYPNSKQVTLRTYLHRMNTRGLIEPGLARGFWQLPKSQQV